MRTFAIVREMRLHWEYPLHPIYLAEGRRARTASPYHRFTLTRFGRTGVPLLIIAGIFLSFLWPPLLIALEGVGLLLCVGGVGFFLLLWPAVIGSATSGVIVTEREKQTLDTLLTIPMDWGDLLIAKLAGALRNRSPWLYAIIWGSSALLLILMNVDCGPAADCRGGSNPGWTVIVLLTVALLLVTTGHQLYVLAALSGVTASLLSGSRSAANAAAVLMATGIAILSNLLILIGQRGIEEGMMVVFRPTFLDQFVAGCMALTLLMLLSETIIHRMFSTLARHLGDGELLNCGIVGGK